MSSVSAVNVRRQPEDATTDDRRLRQHVAAVVASLGGFVFGVSLGWNSKAFEVFRNTLDASNEELGLIGAILNAGASVGLLAVPFLLHFLSRTATMFLTIPFFFVAWTCICFAGEQIYLFIIGRLICGACGGVFCVLTPIYVSEIADKDIRGRLLTFFQLSINCGVTFAFTVAHFLEEEETVWKYSLICGTTCSLLALVNFLPESSLYHLTRNDETSARRSLEWLQGGTEFEDLRKLAIRARSHQVTMETFRNWRTWRSILTCLGVILTQQLSGINIMLFYAISLFNLTGTGELTASQQTLVVGLIQIAACCIATILIDIVGRKILLIVSSSLMGLFLILLGWFFNMREEDPDFDEFYSWMPPTWTALFFASFNLGIGPITWVLIGEIFPVELKTTAGSIVASMSWSMSLVATMTFGEIIEILGIPQIMWLFATISWIGGIVCAILLRDNKGKSLLEIQEEFRTNVEISNDGEN